MLFCKYVMKPVNLKIKKISLMSVSVECTKKEVIRSVSITLLLSSVVRTPPPTTTTTHPSVIKKKKQNVFESASIPFTFRINAEPLGGMPDPAR